MTNASRFLTADESQGEALTTVIDGTPAGLSLTAEAIDARLAGGQLDDSRGGGMHIERDCMHIFSGTRWWRPRLRHRPSDDADLDTLESR
jgi:chorismate synthase